MATALAVRTLQHLSLKANKKTLVLSGVEIIAALGIQRQGMNGHGAGGEDTPASFAQSE